MSPRFRVVAFLRRPSGLAARHSSAAAAPDDDSRARSFGAAIWRTRGEPVRRRRGPDGASIAGRAGGRRTNGSAKRNGRSRRRRVRLYSPPPPNDRRRPVFSLRFMFFYVFLLHTRSATATRPLPPPRPRLDGAFSSSSDSFPHAIAAASRKPAGPAPVRSTHVSGGTARRIGNTTDAGPRSRPARETIFRRDDPARGVRVLPANIVPHSPRVIRDERYKVVSPPQKKNSLSPRVDEAS